MPPLWPDGGLADDGRDTPGGRVHRYTRPGRHEIAVDVPERDRSKLRRARRACHPTDITVFREDLRAVCGHFLRLQLLGLHAQRHQLLRHPSMPAVKNSDDDLLPYVAALAQRDGAVLNSCFERDRLLRHIDAEQRIAGFNPHRVEDSGFHGNRASLEKGAPQVRLARRLDVGDEARDAQLADARNHN